MLIESIDDKGHKEVPSETIYYLAISKDRFYEYQDYHTVNERLEDTILSDNNPEGYDYTIVNDTLILKATEYWPIRYKGFLKHVKVLEEDSVLFKYEIESKRRNVFIKSLRDSVLILSDFGNDLVYKKINKGKTTSTQEELKGRLEEVVKKLEKKEQYMR
jgi:hypothetical protein